MSETAIVDQLTPLPGEVMHEAWQKADTQLEADAARYWRENGILPQDANIETRLKQLVLVAYVGDALAGITTAMFVRYDPLRARFANLRLMVVPEFRLQYLQVRMSVRSKQIVSAWTQQNPQANISGMMTVRQADYQATRKTPPRTPSTQSTLVGYTDQNQQIRVNWFEHARV